MKFLPTWDELNEGIKKFEAYLKTQLEKHEGMKKDFKNEHEGLHKLSATASNFLPYPFNKIAEFMLVSSGSSMEERLGHIRKYLNDLISVGEAHYNHIITNLEENKEFMHNMSDIMAKEKTVRELQEVILSSDSNLDRKINVMIKEIVKDSEIIEKTAEIIKDNLWKKHYACFILGRMLASLYIIRGYVNEEPNFKYNFLNLCENIGFQLRSDEIDLLSNDISLLSNGETKLDDTTISFYKKFMRKIEFILDPVEIIAYNVGEKYVMIGTLLGKETDVDAYRKIYEDLKIYEKHIIKDTPLYDLLSKTISVLEKCPGNQITDMKNRQKVLNELVIVEKHFFPRN